MGTRHSVKNGTLGKIHRIRTNLVLFAVLPSATLGKTDRISVLSSATLGKICPHNFFVCFSAYPVTISNKITGNYNNMTDRQYISHICPQMSHPLTITNICRQAPCKVHKHHQHMSKFQPSPTKSTVQHTKLSNKVGWPVTWSEACGETESSPGLDHPAYRCSIQL